MIFQFGSFDLSSIQKWLGGGTGAFTMDSNTAFLVILIIVIIVAVYWAIKEASG